MDFILIQQFLTYNYFGNSVLEYLISLSVFISIFILIKIFKYLIIKRLKRFFERTKTSVDDFLLNNIQKYLIPLLYFVAIYTSLNFLKLSPGFRKIIDSAVIIVTSIFAIIFIASVVNYVIRYYWEKNDGEQRRANLKGISAFINLLVWGLGLIFLLDNLGFKISAVIAGLGIGGIAVALAAQAILGDLFSYFVIIFDKPFQIGDFIVVDDKLGTVEYIGIKTTRIASLGGEQIVLANSDLTRSRIHNYKKLIKRRVVFRIGVTYQTKLELLKEMPSLIKSIIENNENVTFDRAHFFSFGDFSLVFEIVYFVIGPDYNKYMDIQQNINLKLYEEFQARGIEFAYTSNSIYLSNISHRGNIPKLET